MRSRIFEIVVFLIDYIQGDTGHLSESDDLWTSLEAQGYSEDEISSAYSWLMKRFDSPSQQLYSSFPKTHSSSRILTSLEHSQLTTKAHGFLMKLLNLSLIDDEQLEAIMDRVSSFDPKPATLDHIKLIASSIVFPDLDEFDALTLLDAKGDYSSFVN